jgi:hypothetical protein
LLSGNWVGTYLCFPYWKKVLGIRFEIL